MEQAPSDGWDGTDSTDVAILSFAMDAMEYFDPAFRRLFDYRPVRS